MCYGIKYCGNKKSEPGNNNQNKWSFIFKIYVKRENVQRKTVFKKNPKKTVLKKKKKNVTVAKWKFITKSPNLQETCCPLSTWWNILTFFWFFAIYGLAVPCNIGMWDSRYVTYQFHCIAFLCCLVFARHLWM